MELFCQGILAGMFLGVVAWEIGKYNMRRMQKKHGCFDVCYHCGKPPFDD